jgi:anti-anti-sigma factor
MEILDRPGAITWVRMKGRLDLPGVEAVEIRFLALAGPGRPLVVDLSAVAFVGSLGIAMFFQAARALTMRKAPLVLLSPSELVEKVFRTSGLFEVSVLARSEEDAAAASAVGTAAGNG